MEKKYSRLSLEERIKIQTLLEENKSKSYIAKKLKRARSTITREISNWCILPVDRYKASLSHWCSNDMNKSKHKTNKIDANKRLKMYIYRGLLSKLSPDIIAGRIKLDYPNDESMRISHEAIYQYIYTHPQGKMNLKLIALLHRHKSRRRKRSYLTNKRGYIKDSISIEQRPPIVNTRANIGDFEGDLIIGKGQQSAIGTLVDRKTRFVYIVKMKNRKSKTVVNAFIKALNTWPKKYASTMTYDNGKEMAEHKLFTKKTGMKVYFAHPYSSWERGTNENTNGMIRRIFPKGTDFNEISEYELLKVQDWLNNRPRKILEYKTPTEALIEQDIIFSFFKQLHKKKLLKKRKKTNFDSLIMF